MPGVETVLAFLFTLLFAAPCLAQTERLSQKLSDVRSNLRLEGEHLEGPGAQVLARAIADVQFVAIGEDHGMSEVPRFVSAVCGMLGPSGFRTMAVEAGPIVTSQLQRWVHVEDGRTQLKEFLNRFPWSIAFYDMREEYDALATCAAKLGGHQFRLWGLDQEFLGSPKLLLTEILQTQPQRETAAFVRQLVNDNDRLYARAEQTGAWNDLFMYALSDDQLKRLQELCAKGCSPKAQSLVTSLTQTRRIYQLQAKGANYDSNRERAKLMKTTFSGNYERVLKQDGAPVKVLLKFGLNHLYRGFNLVGVADVGNFVSETAEGTEGARSIHIAVLAVKARQLYPVRIGKPYEPKSVDYATSTDSPLGSMKVIFDNLARDGWTLSDLRRVRSDFSNLGPVSKEIERMIFGYDLLVVIPEGTASHQID